MNYTVRITDTAKQDLREIAFYIAEQSKNKETAIRFVRGLKEHCQKLNSFPYKGALPKDRILISVGYRYLVHRDYLIFYNIEEAETIVNILAIFNSKKDYIRVMRKFI